MTFHGGIAKEQLLQLIERIERLEEEKTNIQEDIKSVFGESKSQGFDVKIMKQIIKLRKMNHNDVEEQEYLLDVYKRALGMAVDAEEEKAA